MKPMILECEVYRKLSLVVAKRRISHSPSLYSWKKVLIWECGVYGMLSLSASAMDLELFTGSAEYICQHYLTIINFCNDFLIFYSTKISYV